MLPHLFLRIVVAPWIVVVWIVRFGLRLVRLPRKLRAMNADQVICPDGHPNPLMGRWTCRCGGVYLGHAFGPCPICGAVAGWLRCATCGLGIRSPWKED